MDPLEYVLNKMESAAQANNPAKAGYGQARKDLLDGISALRSRAEKAERDWYDYKADFDARFKAVLHERDAAYLRAGERWKELDAERQDHGITKRERDGMRRVLALAMEPLLALDASVEWELCDSIKQAIKDAIAAERKLAN